MFLFLCRIINLIQLFHNRTTFSLLFGPQSFFVTITVSVSQANTIWSLELVSSFTKGFLPAASDLRRLASCSLNSLLLSDISHIGIRPFPEFLYFLFKKVLGSRPSVGLLGCTRLICLVIWFLRMVENRHRVHWYLETNSVDHLFIYIPVPFLQTKFKH